MRATPRCAAVYDGTRKMLVITGEERMFEDPTGFDEAKVLGQANLESQAH